MSVTQLYCLSTDCHLTCWPIYWSIWSGLVTITCTLPGTRPGAVLGKGWRGFLLTSSPWDVAFVFVFTFKICLLQQSVTPFLSGPPLLRKILDLPLKTQTNINIHTCYTCACTPVLYFTYKASALIFLVLCLIRSLLDILVRLMRFLMQSHTAKEHLSFECSMIMSVKRFEPNFD